MDPLLLLKYSSRTLWCLLKYTWIFYSGTYCLRLVHEIYSLQSFHSINSFRLYCLIPQDCYKILSVYGHYLTSKIPKLTNLVFYILVGQEALIAKNFTLYITKVVLRSLYNFSGWQSICWRPGRLPQAIQMPKTAPSNSNAKNCPHLQYCVKLISCP